MRLFQRAEDPGRPGPFVPFKHEAGGAQSRRRTASSRAVYGVLRPVAAGALCLVLAACGAIGGGGGPGLGSIGHVRGFIGGVASDGPRASLVARNMLSAGGSAADAAVAAAFMLTVTYPVAASIAGGGQCVVFDGPRKSIELIDFPVRAPAAGGTVPVPGLVRGLALLHAAHGRLPWSQLVSPAEQVARFGERVSRAYARALLAPDIVTRLSPQAQRVLTSGSDGRLLDEGAPHDQPELASTLSRIRIAGAGDLYSGLLARSYVDAADDFGGRVGLEDMRGYAVQTSMPASRAFDAFTVYFGGPAAAETVALWDRVAQRRSALLPDTADLQALPAALLALAGAPASDPVAALGSTSIAVADREGQAVACSLTLGAPFGSGLYAAATGTVLAAMPGMGPPPQSALAAIGSPNSWRARGAFAATSGGVSGAAPAALLETMLPILAEDATARAAQAATRYAPTDGGAAMAVEPGAVAGGAAAGQREALEATGLPLAVVPDIGRVNIAYCADGIPVDDEEGCTFAHDPRGFGLGAGHSF